MCAYDISHSSKVELLGLVVTTIFCEVWLSKLICHCLVFGRTIWSSLVPASEPKGKRIFKLQTAVVTCTCMSSNINIVHCTLYLIHVWWIGLQNFEFLKCVRQTFAPIILSQKQLWLTDLECFARGLDWMLKVACK